MERVIECTTSQFDGLIGLVQPKASWVAKWQRIGELPLTFSLSHSAWNKRETNDNQI